MKRKLQNGCALALLWLAALPVQAQTWQWATKAGGLGNDYANSLDVDDSGNSYVTGKFYDSISFDSITLYNPGVWSVYIAKYDMNGNILWAKIAASDSSISVSGISLSKSGNAAITGHYFGTAAFGTSPIINLTSSADYDVYVAMYNPYGDLIWAKSLGGQGIDNSGGIDTDNDGNVFLTGDFHFSSFPYSSSKIFLAKYDSSGNAAWLKSSLNYGLDHFGNGIKVDSVGNSFITGEFFDTLIFDSSAIINAGNVESNIFLAKFDSSGNILWGQKAGAASGYCGSKAIDIDHAGNSYIAGYYHGTIALGTLNITSTMGLANEVLIAKCDAAGNFVWVNKSTGAGSVKTIGLDNQANAYISGTFQQTISFDAITLTSSGGNDIYIAKVNSFGNFAWATSAGGLQNDYIGWLKANSDGIFLTGYFSDTIHFGPSLSLIANDSITSDIFLTKMDATTEIVIKKDNNLLRVFPNPVTDAFKIITNEEKGELKLFDFLGNEVLQKSIEHEKQITLDVSFLPSGIYFLRLNSVKGISTSKIIKE
jgi:hypothetical protein